jgi:hypothetical protein
MFPSGRFENGEAKSKNQEGSTMRMVVVVVASILVGLGIGALAWKRNPWNAVCFQALNLMLPRAGYPRVNLGSALLPFCGSPKLHTGCWVWNGHPPNGNIH